MRRYYGILFPQAPFPVNTNNTKDIIGHRIDQNPFHSQTRVHAHRVLKMAIQPEWVWQPGLV